MNIDDALDDARLTAHQRAMATDPKYRAGYEKFLQDRKLRKAEIKARRTRRRHRLHVLGDLPMPRVYLRGPRCWRFCRDSQPDPNAWRPHVYDFEPDVRELVCEPVQFDRVAMWADPRERL